jgi:hypothetical protein
LASKGPENGLSSEVVVQYQPHGRLSTIPKNTTFTGGLLIAVSSLQSSARELPPCDLGLDEMRKALIANGSLQDVAEA